MNTTYERDPEEGMTVEQRSAYHLGQINARLGSIEKTAETTKRVVEKGWMRIVMALIGLVAATIGVKYLGTPILIEISYYVVWIAGFITIANLWHGWKRIKWCERIVIIAFILMLFSSALIRTFIAYYHIVPPEWFVIYINVFYGIIAIALMFAYWRK